MAKVRIILIVLVLAVMGGIGFTLLPAVGGGKEDAAMLAAVEKFDTYEEYAASDEAKATKSASSGSGGGSKAGSLIKSTKTISRVGGDKTITIQRRKPGIIMRIRMWLGYTPEDAHRRDFARLKAQRSREASRSVGVNSATGRRESTATRNIGGASSSPRKKAAPNKSLASALSK